MPRAGVDYKAAALAAAALPVPMECREFCLTLEVLGWNIQYFALAADISNHTAWRIWAGRYRCPPVLATWLRAMLAWHEQRAIWEAAHPRPVPPPPPEDV